MKTRIVLSLLTIAFAWIAEAIYRLFYSPITGVATAQTVNDDVQSYALAKFIRDGGVENSIFYLTLFVLLLIWISPICNLFKSNKNNVR